MKKYKLFFTVFCLTAIISADNSISALAAETEVATETSAAFHPVDCSIPALEYYEYPFLGLKVTLSPNLLEKLSNHDIFLFTAEDYTATNQIAYATMRFSAVTQTQKEEKVTSVDILAWEAALEKIGAITLCQKDLSDQLDELTGCDTHSKIGESTDGIYHYYLSTNSSGNAADIAELENSEVSFSEMHTLDMSLGYSAFSTDRIDGVGSVGIFHTEDVFGTAYTQDLFANYDLTLVNAFTTWCSPCVNEMPELEQLRQEYAEKGVQLGIAAVVLDARTASGIDETAVQQAMLLSARSGVQFPFLIPDEGYMNDRLIGIESVPESFFVDSNGNIVSDPYIGANSKEGWSAIVEQELDKLEEGS